MEVYQEIPRRQLALPDTRTIVQSLSHVKSRVSFWVFPPRLWRLTKSVLSIVFLMMDKTRLY